MKKLLTILAALSLTFALGACKPKEDDEPVVVDNAAPTFAGITDVNLNYGDAFDELNGVTAADAEDGDLTSSIYVSGEVNLVVPGTYTLTYSVEDKDGEITSMDRDITLVSDYTFPSGFYNFKFENTELRHYFMATAEKFIMNNMNGGIPLFASGSFNLYSSRLQLPVDEYVAVMGFGTSFATMSADDSTVLMDSGLAGVAGEYTYRTTVGANPVTFNQWLYDTSTDSDLMSVYYDALYIYEFNADKSGYEVNGSMAAGVPVPMESETLDSGKVVANKWQITLRDDLTWKFHEDVDAAFLATSPDMTIDANDFVDTFELALSEEWFRAVSGGGDFLNEATGVKNAQEFVDGSVTWDQVGFKVIDDATNDLTLEIEFINQMSEWNVKYFLSSFVMSPVSIELYDFLGTGLDADEVNAYGTNEKTVGYHGAYYVKTYEADKVVRMRENTSYHSPDDYFFTGYDFSVITDNTIIFNEFIAGKLEGTSLPTAEVENYENHPGLKRVPGATTYRLMVNGFGDVASSRATFPDGEWIPEPLLGEADFKSAMFFALDRQKLAEDILKTRSTNMYYFSNAYLVDPELGVPYRESDAGLTVGEGLSPDTYGFNFDAARALYLSAVNDLVHQGVYEAGTAASPTIITIELNNYSDSESWDLACAYIKTAFEAAFQDSENHINVQVDIYTKDFPAIYYDYMMTGEFDTSVGGISGSTLDAASFLDTYSSDDRSGFTINWGFDSGIAEIPVVYSTLVDGVAVEHKEIWSYDAIVSALNGEIYLIDGEEAVIPAAKNFSYTPTSASFTIDQFDNAKYSTITYTVQWYDVVTGTYMDVAGMVDMPATTADITVTGLTPGYEGYDIMGNEQYVGDYQIKIGFKYVAEDQPGSSVSPWFMTEELVSDVTVESTLDTATVGFAINTNDVARTVSTIKAYYEMTPAVAAVAAAAAVVDDPATTEVDETAAEVIAVVAVDAVWAMDAAAVVDSADLTAIAITMLMPETDYVLEVVFSDGAVRYIAVSTAPIYVAGDVKVTQTFALFDITLDADYEGVLTSAMVYDKDMMMVTGAAVDFSHLELILVTGLSAETTYYVELTFDDGEVRLVMVTTEAVPVVVPAA